MKAKENFYWTPESLKHLLEVTHKKKKELEKNKLLTKKNTFGSLEFNQLFFNTTIQPPDRLK